MRAAILICACVTFATQISARTTKITSEYEKEIVMMCNRNDSYFPPKEKWSGGKAKWILPNADVIESPWVEPGRVPLRQTADDGSNLTISHLLDEHFGIYMCVVVNSDDQKWYVAKYGVNPDGPYFGNLWERYRLNVIIGCSAAGGFLLICLGALAVYTFRYKEEDEEDEEKRSLEGGMYDVSALEANAEIPIYENESVLPMQTVSGGSSGVPVTSADVHTPAMVTLISKGHENKAYAEDATKM